MKALLPGPAPKQRRKQRDKRPGKRPPKRPGDNGGSIFTGGVPGNKGGGRLANEFKEFLATEILGSAHMRENLKRIADLDLAVIGAKDPVLAIRAAQLVLQVAAWSADRVEGKASQPLRFDPSETAKVAALRELTNEELIAHLKTIDSELAHE